MTVCVGVSPFAVVEKYLDFRGTGTPEAALLDVSSELASISETSRKVERFSTATKLLQMDILQIFFTF